MNRNPSPELIFAPLSFHRALLEPDSGLVLLEDKAEAGKGKALFFFFLVALGFGLRASCLLGRLSYHLSHSASPGRGSFGTPA
jgi:hypothetical protein